MTTSPHLLVLLALSAGCTSDFGLGKAGQPIGGPADTAAPEDTAAEEQPVEEEDPQDSGLPVEETEDSGDTAAPSEEEEEEDADPPAEDDCDHSSDLIYVIAQDDAALYLFDPATLDFTKLGVLDCTDWAEPESMSVGRDGVAYVRFSDESVYAVDVETLRCTETAYSDRSTGFGSFGMGFATNSADTWRDRLYVANEDRLSILDTSTFALTPVGRMPSQSELSGNAEGELWAMLPLEVPAELVQLDKTTAEVTETLRLPGFPDAGNIDTFAFATWGGEFWLFVREFGMGSSTDVYRVTADGTMSLALDDIGWDVVGAGVSTCAPTE